MGFDDSGKDTGAATGQTEAAATNDGGLLDLDMMLGGGGAPASN